MRETNKERSLVIASCCSMTSNPFHDWVRTSCVWRGGVMQMKDGWRRILWWPDVVYLPLQISWYLPLSSKESCYSSSKFLLSQVLFILIAFPVCREGAHRLSPTVIWMFAEAKKGFMSWAESSCFCFCSWLGGLWGSLFSMGVSSAAEGFL